MYIAYIVLLHRAQGRQTPFLEVQHSSLFAFQQEKYAKLLDTNKYVNYKKIRAEGTAMALSTIIIIWKQHDLSWITSQKKTNQNPKRM